MTTVPPTGPQDTPQGGVPQQPYPQQPMQGQPYPAQPYPQQPVPGQAMGAPGQPYPQQPMPVLPADPQADLPVENVGKGLLLSLVGILGGIILTTLVWQIGFIASITSWAMAAAAIFMYTKGSGGRIRKGALPLVLMIVLGVVLSMLTCVGVEAARYYDAENVAADGISKLDFLVTNLTDLEVLGQFTKEFVMMLLFAMLGMWGVVKNLIGSARA